MRDLLLLFQNILRISYGDMWGRSRAAPQLLHLHRYTAIRVYKRLCAVVVTNKYRREAAFIRSRDPLYI